MSPDSLKCLESFDAFFYKEFSSMKGETSRRSMRVAWTGLRTVALVAVAATTTIWADDAMLPARIQARALTTGDVAAYKLPAGTELSGGLNTVSVGEPVYLDAQIDINIPASSVAGVIWTITMKPNGSAATLTDSPLGANVPVFEPSDRSIYQVAGRKVLRPDVVGEYVVTATITAGSAGTMTVGQTFIAGKYVGKAACTVCHSGGLAEVMVPSWAKTGHAGHFTNGINGVLGSGYSKNCISCHTVGYDLNATVDNGGFSAVAKQLGWTFPAVVQAGNFDAVPDALKNLANIQCENCHGPGSQHANHGGDTLEISVPNNTGACAQCHDAPSHHVKSAEWGNSVHAVTTRHPAGNAACVGCHTGTGFINRINGQPQTDTSYHAIDCYTCHEPHGQTKPDGNDHIVRTLQAVTLADGTQITSGGAGMLCMNCHQSRQKASTYAATMAASTYFGPHIGTQSDMFMGTNGFTYGQQIPSSAHKSVVEDACVTCHMQDVAIGAPGFLAVGGHTFKPSLTQDGKPKLELVAACQNCHGKDMTTFNMARIDYNGDGTIEGVQTEVQKLLDQLSTMLPPNNNVKSSLTIDSTWTRAQLEAGYNWQFVNNDGSRGIHNTAYAVGLLKASIADLQKK